jgi:hypothetical protein
MPVSLSLERELATQTEALNVSVISDAPVENTTYVLWRALADNITPAPFNLTADTTSGDPTIAAADLSSLRVGDAIAGTNITGTVLSIDTSVNPNTATLDANASDTGSESLTVTPPAYDLALLSLKLNLAPSIDSKQIAATLEIRTFDGTDSADTDADGKDNAVGNPVQTISMSIPIDSILSAARVARS